MLLSPEEALKRDMKETVNLALYELTRRFRSEGGKLYELAGMLMSATTCLQDLHSITETLYPQVDATEAVAQFNMVRHISNWATATTLRQRALAYPPSMEALRKLYRIMLTVPVTRAECERTFSKLALIKSKLRTTCGQQRLENLVLCSIEREILNEVDVEKVVDRFSALSGDCQPRWIKLTSSDFNSELIYTERDY